ncbi:MAG: LptF/LptG family permease [Aquificae bacterium]|nr:LptF/LptG family permease [Aquificota bacterium]
MLAAFIFYRFLRLSFLAALVLALILLSLQITRLSNILLGLPPQDLAVFFTVWLVSYTYFFLPDGVILSTASLVFYFKEKKLLHVLYSFRISDLRLLSFFLRPFVVIFVLLVALHGTVLEEKVAFIRKNLLFEYKEKLFRDVPPGTFLRLGNIVLHVEEKEGEKLKKVFFRFGNLTILASSLEYRGGGLFLFREGTVITQEEDKYFLVSFREYLLNLKQFEKKELREKRLKESRLVNITNAFLSPFLFGGVFWVCLRFCSRVSHLYFTVALFVVLHQLVVFVVKVLL